jgi:uncharacterized protein (DUF362 family)
MMPPVSIVRCKNYDEKEVLKALRRSVDLIGGMDSFVRKGNSVLLKPNLLYGKKPEKAVTTHPSIIRAVIHQCAELCPPRALKENEKGLAFDYGKCIRCFCCQEICPEGAITVQQGWALKIYSQIRSTKSGRYDRPHRGEFRNNIE